LTISIPPVLPWESRKVALTIRSRSAFYPYHITSRLCLDLLDHCIKTFHVRSLLDVGCGSGILAIAAAAMGVPFVVGLDIDPRAIHVSRDNAARNRLQVPPHWILGTVASLRAGFECVAANLPLDLLMETASDLKRLLLPKGHLILSGFHDIHFQSVQRNILWDELRIEKGASGDLSFGESPPSGSYTWMAVWARRLAHSGIPAESPGE
jgi:ribosomal protein L11 methylase PrmA